MLSSFLAPKTPVHIITIGYGVTVGWTGPIIPLLQSADTPLPGGPITVEQVSWVGSFFSIGGMSGTILYALIHTYFGKKTGLLMLAIPHLVRKNPQSVVSRRTLGLVV